MRHFLTLLSFFSLTLSANAAEWTSVTALGGVEVPAFTLHAVEWDGTVVDTMGAWDAANPTRLTVPEGCSLVRLSFQVELTRLNDDACNPGNELLNGACSEESRVFVRQNGVSAGFGMPATWHAGELPINHNGHGAVLFTAPERYFEVFVLHSHPSVQIRTGRSNFFEMECVNL